MDKTVLAGLLAAALLVGSGTYVYLCGKDDGKEVVQKKWDAEKKLYDTAIAGLKDHYGMLEAANRTKTEELTHDLAEAQKNHDIAIAVLFHTLCSSISWASFSSDYHVYLSPPAGNIVSYFADFGSVTLSLIVLFIGAEFAGCG